MSKSGKIRAQSPPIKWRIDPKTGEKKLSKDRKSIKGTSKGGMPFRGKQSRDPMRRNRRRSYLVSIGYEPLHKRKVERGRRSGKRRRP